MTVVAGAALIANGFIFSLDVYNKAVDVNSNWHDLISLTQTASAAASIKQAPAIVQAEEKIITPVSSGAIW